MYFLISDKRSWVKSLMLECPMGKSLNDCPLTVFRRLDIKNRMNAVNRMDDGEIEGIIQNHTECIRMRESFFPKIPGDV